MFLKTLYRAAIGFTLAAAFSGAAFAQSTILVVDTNRVIQESTVGKHVTRQLETIMTSAQSELQAKASPLQTKGKSLQEQLKAKGNVENVRADAALTAQLQTFQTDQQKLQVEQYYIQNEMKVTEAKALNEVSKRVKTIIDQIARERNADVVLEKSLVIYGGPADVTDTVISRLNAQVSTVPVVRERLPRKG